MAGSTNSDTPAEIQTVILQVVRKHSLIDQLKWTEDSDDIRVTRLQREGPDDVYRVYSDNDSMCSVLVKNVRPYGSEEPRDQSHDRGEVEFSALNKFESLSPGCAVKPLFYDKDTRLLCTEDLRDYAVYRNSLVDGLGHLDDDTAVKIARDLAIIHRDTHVAKIGEVALKELESQFQNSNTMTSRQQFLFTAPFSRDDPTNRCSDALKARFDWFYSDPEVTRAAANMKKVFLEKKEALIHGDFCTGSVLVKDNDARITNTGFAFVGPCSLDLGMLIANYIFAHYRHMICMEDNDERRVIAYKIVEVCSQTVDEYFRHMTSMTGDSEMFYAKFISEVAGFAGCEIVRRLLGPHHVLEMQLTPEAEVDTLGAGVRLLKAYDRIHSIGTLLLIALMLA